MAELVGPPKGCYYCFKCHTQVTLPGTTIKTQKDNLSCPRTGGVHRSSLLNIKFANEIERCNHVPYTRKFYCNFCHAVLGSSRGPGSLGRSYFFHQDSTVKLEKNHKVIENAKKDDVNGKKIDDSSQSEAPPANVDQIQMVDSLSHKVEAGLAKIDAQLDVVQERFKTINWRLDVVRDNVKDIYVRLDKFKTCEERINENAEAMVDMKAEIAEFNFSKLLESIDVLQQQITVMDGRISNLDTEWVL